MGIPDDNCRCMYRMFLFSQAKAGHWETEKASIKMRSVALYGTSQKTCFDIISQVLVHRNNRFYCIVKILHAFLLCNINCVCSQKNSAAAIF